MQKILKCADNVDFYFFLTRSHIRKPRGHNRNLHKHQIIEPIFPYLQALNHVSDVARVLLNGGVIAVPTDTLYGLACCGLHTKAIEKLYCMKGRDATKPMAICLDKAHSIPYWCQIKGISMQLLEMLLPGPVTVVLPRKLANDPLSPNLNPGVQEIAIRVPDCPLVCRISSALASEARLDLNQRNKATFDIDVVSALPLVLTSANVSGQQSTLSPEEFSSLWPMLDIVIDGGRIETGKATQDACLSRAGSTIVDLSDCVRSGSNCYSIIREGSALLQTEKILKQFNLRNANV